MTNATHIVLRLPGFYAGLERRLHGLDPDGALLVLAGEGSRALVLSACPEAMSQGVRPGMRLGQLDAFRGRTVQATPDRYAAADRELAQRLAGELPEVGPLRPGVFRATWSSGRRFLEPALAHAERMLCGDGLAAAWGIAPGDACAEIAAAIAPVGERVTVDEAGVQAFLADKPVRLLPDLTADHVRALAEIGVHGFGQLAGLPEQVLRSLFGPDGPKLRRVALHGDRGPAPEQWRGRRNFGEDTADLNTVRRALAELVADGHAHVHQHRGRLPRRMLLTLLYTDGRRAGARITSARPEHEGSWQREAGEQLQRVWTRRVRLREIRLAVEWNGSPPDQLALFVQDSRQFRDRRLTRAVGAVRDRWGRDGVQFAVAGSGLIHGNRCAMSF